jgi:hypothetical protein
MKLWIASVLVVCACAQGGRAEDASTKHSITGCLRSGKTANSYMISSRVAGSPRAAGIVSSSADLAPHLGQKVEITGTMIPSKEAEADPNVPRAARYMKVTAIKKIADACP